MDAATVVFLAQMANGSMNVPAWTFFTVAISAICTPLINAWMRRADKRADWKRQDEVAKRVEEAKAAVSEAATSLIKSNAAVTEAQEVNETNQQHIRKSLHAVLDEVNAGKSERQNQSEILAEIQTQGTVIKGLVNGSLTTAMEAELDSKRTQVTLMRQIIALKGGNPSQEALDAIARLEGAIEKLDEAINERRKIEAEANAQANHIATIKASTPPLKAKK